MWAEVEASVTAVRARLREHGLDVRATVEPCEGLLCGYRDGVVRLTLPTLSTPEGTLRATLLGAMMGVEGPEVAWLFRALLPRLIAHEFGHALRDEAGLLSGDVCVEEQVADRVATLVSAPMISARDTARAAEMLSFVTSRLGGANEAAALHRHAAIARQRLGLGAPDDVTSRARDTLQHTYWRDVNAYLRLTSAWAWLDLTLNQRDDFDALRRDHFTA